MGQCACLDRGSREPGSPLAAQGADGGEAQATAPGGGSLPSRAAQGPAPAGGRAAGAPAVARRGEGPPARGGRSGLRCCRRRGGGKDEALLGGAHKAAPAVPSPRGRGQGGAACRECPEEDLRWVDEETERAGIEALRARLAADLRGCPADMVHDLSLLRFLRGHGHDVDVAARYMSKALKYRRELATSASLGAFRASVASATAIDMSALPHGEVLDVLPLRSLRGASRQGLPIMLTAPRLMDFEAFAAVRKPRLDGFLKAHLEQRAVVLHNLSLQQRRMVKFVELRDLSQTSPALLLRSGRPVFKRLKTFFSILQDCYPELVHQVLFFNAPAGAARLVAMLSSILNARMMAKIRLLPVAQAYTEMTWRLNAMAISSWMEQVSKAVDLNTMRLARGTEEYAARWLAKGQTLRWTVTVREKDVRFQYVFIEENCGARELEPLRMEETAVVAGAPLRGSLVAPGGGVFWARVSNAFSWLESKQCALLLE